MRFNSPIVFLIILFCILFSVADSVCAEIVMNGDPIYLNFSCYLKNGELADTTLRGVSEDHVIKKSKIFFPEPEYKMERMQANVKTDEIHWSKMSFRSEIVRRLSSSVVGAKVGDTERFEINSVVPSDIPYDERFIKVARVQKRARHTTMTTDSFRHYAKEEPTAGKQYAFTDGLIVKVISVEADFVQVSISPPIDGNYMTEFGPATMRDAGTFFELDIDVRPGKLFRAGPLVGRISQVDENWITIDFGHPFGGDSLTCDVRVESIQNSVEQAAEMKETWNSLAVQAGDAVLVNYSARFESSEVLRSHKKNAVSNVHGNNYGAPADGAPQNGSERLIAGEGSAMPGLSTEVIGMKPGERKQARLPAGKAFGLMDDLGVISLQAEKRLPRVLAMDPAEFKRHFQVEPQLEAEVPLTPYFKGRVVAFEGQNAIIAAQASESSVPEKFGTVAIRIVGDEIVIKMKANVGADFEMIGRRGRIIKVDQHEFTVDFNHPLAGKDLLLEIEIVSLTKAAQLKDSRLAWLEDYEQGVEAAADRKKPMVLLLHAEWCDWCKKLMAESLQDLRIKMLRDDFVWVKIDSDKQPELAAKFDQKAFPMVVILDRKGNLAKRIDGYRDAAALKKELEEVL